MTTETSVSLGARVRIMQAVRPGEAPGTAVGKVIRVDPRGVLVELESGSKVLCEPRFVALVDGERPT